MNTVESRLKETRAAGERAAIASIDISEEMLTSGRRRFFGRYQTSLLQLQDGISSGC